MTSVHRLLVCLLLALLAAAPAFAQGPLPTTRAAATTDQATAEPPRTRVEAIAAEQRRKAMQVVPETRGVVEETLVRILSSPLLSGTGGLYPWFGSVFGGSGFSFGAGYLRRLPRGARFNTVAGISINGSTLLEATASAPGLVGGRLEPRLVVRRQEVNDVSFYGLGQDSSFATRTAFAFTPTAVGAGLALRPARFVELTAGYEWLDVGTGVDDVPASGVDDVPASGLAVAGAPGLGDSYGFDVLRTGLAVDTRPAPAYATRGTLARVGVTRYAARDSAGYSFDEVEVEAAHLMPLLRNQYVVAVRALGTFTSADDGQQVPVPLMPFLGSGNTLRGFANRRFYDTNRVLVTGEYRWLPSRYIDMAVFLDAGQVGPAPSRFRLSDVATSWGVGVRVHGPAFNAFRVDVARSREQWEIVFAASQPF